MKAAPNTKPRPQTDPLTILQKKLLAHRTYYYPYAHPVYDVFAVHLSFDPYFFRLGHYSRSKPGRTGLVHPDDNWLELIAGKFVLIDRRKQTLEAIPKLWFDSAREAKNDKSKDSIIEKMCASSARAAIRFAANDCTFVTLYSLEERSDEYPLALAPGATPHTFASLYMGYKPTPLRWSELYVGSHHHSRNKLHTHLNVGRVGGFLFRASLSPIQN